MSSSDTILARLATSGWFAKHGEVALTTGLAHCLQKDVPAASALLRLVGARIGLDLPTLLLWRAEGIQDNRARVDVVGSHDDAHGSWPLVFIEAKVLAAFADNQVLDYVAVQQRALAGSRLTGVVVVLVPESRVSMVVEELAHDLSRVDATRDGRIWVVPGPPEVRVTVMSWDEVVAAMQELAIDSAADLDQLIGAARALRGSDVAAFSARELTGAWRQRREDVAVLIERVSEDATRTLGFKLAPWQTRALDGLEGGYRYIGIGGEAVVAVGVREACASPVLWVRWHRSTEQFRLIAARLVGMGITPQESGGHLWVPLNLVPDTGVATRQIENLASEVEELYRVAADRPAEEAVLS